MSEPRRRPTTERRITLEECERAVRLQIASIGGQFEAAWRLTAKLNTRTPGPATLTNEERLLCVSALSAVVGMIGIEATSREPQ